MQPINLGDALATYHNTGAGEAIQHDVSTLQPGITTLTGPVRAPDQFIKTPSQSSSGSAISQFGHFLGGLASGIGHIAEGAAKWTFDTLKSGAESFIKTPYYLGKMMSDNNTLKGYNQASDNLYKQMVQARSDYASGKMNSATYKAIIHDINQQYGKLGNDMNNLNNKIQGDTSNARTNAINMGAAVVTIMTDGASGALVKLSDAAPAANYLVSKEAVPFLQTVQTAVEKFASDPAAFAKLTPEMQRVLQAGTADVLSSAGKVTAAQLSKTVAANLAIKYPLQYSWLSSTGNQLYNELDQQKYGAAVRTVAFNAALMLAGGPFGWATQKLGAVGKNIVARTFEKTSFIDALSKGIGNGDASGLYRAVTKTLDTNELRFFQGGKLVTLTPTEARARLVQNLSSLEATATSRIVGKDPIAAANQVLEGMAGYEGLHMSNFTHEQALTNMNNFVEAARAAKFYGGDNVVVGRIDVSHKTMIANTIAKELNVSKQAALDKFEAILHENSQQAYANNINFTSQIKTLIEKHQNSPEDFRKAVSDIKAQSLVKDVSAPIRNEMAKIGYIPITPTKIEGSLVEGQGKLTSSFAGVKNARGQVVDHAFFTKAVQPLPVLSSIGARLTSMGLSPISSGQKVYEMFNDAFAKNIQQSKDFQAIGAAFKGEDANQTADNIYKQLSGYAHGINTGSITRDGKFITRKVPVMDIRQLTRNDISKALEISPTQAQAVQKEIIQSMLDVPLAVRGLGDRLVDHAMTNGLFRTYLKIQSAGRFAWNPIFQGKLITKTEFASQALAGGKTPVFLTRLFGESKQIDATRQTLKEAGVFEQQSSSAFKGATGLEAVAEGSAVGANLSHELLPVQEKSIAGMINKMADRVGMSPQEFINSNPQNVRDVTQMIAQYDSRSSLLHSPLMRTLNVAFFPIRFDYKVASIMATSLSKMDTLTQVAILNGMLNAHSWLNSPEGMNWYAQNSTALKFLNYFSPTETLNSVMGALSGLSKGDFQTTAGSFELGGLPFGFIPVLLNSEGANFMPAYLDPKTGTELPNKIPVGARAQLQVAIQDFVGSLFSYPGSELGLPSKTHVDNFVASGLTGGKLKSGEYSDTYAPLNAQQKAYQKALGTPQATAPTQANATVPTSVQIPAQNIPTPTVRTGSKRKSKSQFQAQLPQ